MSLMRYPKEMSQRVSGSRVSIGEAAASIKRLVRTLATAKLKP